jgi:hypothetical protein
MHKNQDWQSLMHSACTFRILIILDAVDFSVDGEETTTVLLSDDTKMTR